VIILGIIVAVLAAAAGFIYLMVGMPGRSYQGRLEFTAEERALGDRLRTHVETLAARERNTDLETPLRYIATQLGPKVRFQEFRSGGRMVKNAEVGDGAVVIGAHYDTVPGSPGADDNASAVAALLELARMDLPARFVAFANEEMPYFHTNEMGSQAYAAAARASGQRIDAMISLEMLGCYSDEPGSQRYPPGVSALYPDRGNFIAFVGDIGARSLVRRATGAFRRHAKFPSEGLAAPAAIEGVTRSDHWPFRLAGYQAIMVTDTAYNRYPHYHLPSDTPEKLDYLRMARVTLGVAAVIKELAHEAR
jgi:Zn-dependent M28 family amino/carboxypeptidase